MTDTKPKLTVSALAVAQSLKLSRPDSKSVYRLQWTADMESIKNNLKRVAVLKNQTFAEDRWYAIVKG